MRLLPLVLCALILTGCTTSPTLMGSPEAPYPLPTEMKAGTFFHLPTGHPLTEEAFLEAATDTRVVFVGETHDNMATHRVQLQILRRMEAKFPGQVVLGLEMFHRGQQTVLEAWRLGKMSEKEFLRQSQWDRVWGFDWRLYRDIMRFARDKKIPVIGLNAEKELVGALREKAPDELEASLRERVPEFDTTDPYHTAAVEASFAGHTATKASLERFKRIMLLWDETMADTAARYLDSPDGQDRRMLILAGSRHTDYGIGIPRRLHRRLPVSYTLVGVEEVDLEQQPAEKRMEFTGPDLPMPAYDYVALVNYETLPPQGVKLGVTLDTENLRITGVLAGRPASIAGVQVDDVLLALDEIQLKEFYDLTHELKQRKAGEKATLTIRRGEDTIQLDVTFLPPAPLPKGHPK